ncbi:MAG: hypothetical protein ACE15E_22155, partial [Acidobacteriota bacterium]
MLKLIAWSEASANLRSKHANDLVFIVANYLDLGNAERVYDHDDLMEDFDYEITGGVLSAELQCPARRVFFRAE